VEDSVNGEGHSTAGADDEGDAVVSVVVPTRNRSQLACVRARWALAQPEVREVVFVVDGATDDTAARLQEIADSDARLVVIANERSVGPPAAKNMGVRAATSPWLLVIDDDDVPSDNLVGALLRVAREAGAGVVGVPWFNARSEQTIEEIVARAPRVPGGPRLDEPGLFPDQDWADCLWIHANALFHRSVFDSIAYDEFYFGSCYREENDLFVSAARAGHRVVVAASGYTYMRSRTSGGIDHRSKLRYEYSVIRNSLHFLRKHGKWLRNQGFIRGSAHEQLALMAKRGRANARGVRRRLARIASA
jgi:glycosyltransferase involved in cell wall biosynthesis